LVWAVVIGNKQAAAILQSELAVAKSTRGAVQRRAIQEKAMNKELLAKLRKTKSVKLAGGVVRTLDDAELNSVVGGMRRQGTSSDSISGGIYDDCVD